MIIEKTDRHLVKGFLHAEGNRLVNGAGQEILLTGWGLGNWLNPEGYMWLSDSRDFDRGRNMEMVLKELLGAEAADSFWKNFRKNYIREEDIRAMAQQGYNSVRIPINWRLFLKEKPGITWRNEGFSLLHDVVEWCRTWRVYAIIDLHAAPGGQTGSNIDDCRNNRPELFTDRDAYEKALALWERIAEIYCNDPIVGAYDLLNEPLMPNEGNTFDKYIPDLMRFYFEAAERIRRVDRNHLLSVEGHHWATDPTVFTKRYDTNMVFHFHRYACFPEEESIRPYLDAAEQLQVPLWCGETGENKPEWEAGYFPMLLSYGIGFCAWTWKRMESDFSPCSIEEPECWDHFLRYAKGEEDLNADKGIRILNAYLENIRFENCRFQKNVCYHTLRRKDCTVRATDFDLVGEDGKKAYSGNSKSFRNAFRKKTGIAFYEDTPKKEPAFGFDTEWDRYEIVLHPGEKVRYTFFELTPNSHLVVAGREGLDELEVFQDKEMLTPLKRESTECIFPCREARECIFFLEVADNAQKIAYVRTLTIVQENRVKN